MSVKQSTNITLSVPLAVSTKDGAKMLDAVTLRRPKTGHIKALVALVGADLISALLADTGGDVEKAKHVDLRKLLEPVLPRLLSGEALDRLSVIVADLLGINPKEFDELDPLDTLAVFKGFADFFPALRSIG